MKNAINRNKRSADSEEQGDQTEKENREGREGEKMNNALHELFLDELADVYNAEKQLTKTLPKLQKAAKSEELRSAFESHLRETEGHVTRLEEAARAINESLKRKTCKAMQGIVEEGKETMEEHDDEALDAALIAAAQKAEHYEIATYGTLCAWANRMGHTEVETLLKETLAEEKAADEKLTQIAESIANEQGMEGVGRQGGEE